ncbi:hypothetical protein [Vibrio cholerae]|uniref:hypothetical protein n=1 Tax=Vibrio cholerae TaxID=666 RepID=UPI0012AEDAB1|nr:hypothetical protein [Vibrio cholerae]ELH0845080.1 hypothetical protein [Vibrio cholerae]MBJ6958119.1 hypothetical protein [Vibrio cholerae]MBJ6962080.1 hypothetical protein [Vibrio cholerae]MED7818134.1 hypothetical protein [Vibrio cholerae]NOE72674.1 hypothetical protein [Vibrio cholerae]
MEKLMDDYSGCIDKWNYALYQHCSFHRSLDFDEQEFEKNNHRMNSLLCEMLVIASRESKVKADFSSPRVIPIPHGNAVSIFSSKLNLEVIFGIYINKFYMEASFNYPEYMSKVDCDFWSQLSLLTELGELSFHENTSPDTTLADKLRKQHKVVKSTVFKIIQHCIICADAQCINDGTIEVSWDMSTPLGELLTKLPAVFSSIYKLNNQLYRRHYIVEKSRNKRN